MAKSTPLVLLVLNSNAIDTSRPTLYEATTQRERERLLFTHRMKEGKKTKSENLQQSKGLSASHLTRFQEASAVKIGARLCGDKTSSHHVGGCGRGHVQFEVLDDRLSMT